MENDKGYESMKIITECAAGIRTCISKEMPTLPIRWEPYGQLFRLYTLLRCKQYKWFSPGLLEK